ncbi:MAG: hypothetical protein IKU15_00360 [Clostridia bacterium]|nr:hypothetical protein [Clostridia bacterium]MBR4889754.1 hypothetical protein [Clostridia bacterium]
MNGFAEGYAAGQGNNNYGMNGWGGGFFGEWIWIIILFALFGGWGNQGWGNGGNQQMGYDIGKLATTNDVASGFSTSAIMANQRENQLSQQQGFSDIQQTLCQGFNGVTRAIDSCCCQTQRNIDSVNFNIERSTCNLQRSIDCVGDRIINHMVQRDMANMRDDLLAYKFRDSQYQQNAYLIDQLRPTARPAYLTCSPFESLYSYNYAFNNRGNCNSCWGNGWN